MDPVLVALLPSSVRGGCGRSGVSGGGGLGRRLSGKRTALGELDAGNVATRQPRSRRATPGAGVFVAVGGRVGGRRAPRGLRPMAPCPDLRYIGRSGGQLAARGGRRLFAPGG